MRTRHAVPAPRSAEYDQMRSTPYTVSARCQVKCSQEWGDTCGNGKELKGKALVGGLRTVRAHRGLLRGDQHVRVGAVGVPTLPVCACIFLSPLPRQWHLQNVPGTISIPRASGMFFLHRYLAVCLFGTELSPLYLCSARQMTLMTSTCRNNSSKSSVGLSSMLYSRGSI